MADPDVDPPLNILFVKCIHHIRSFTATIFASLASAIRQTTAPLDEVLFALCDRPLATTRAATPHQPHYSALDRRFGSDRSSRTA
jgi:hypothetical protein